MIFEHKEPCTNCGKTKYIGNSGNDSEGMKVAYRCPSCNSESCDFIPDVDDILPNHIYWSRMAGNQIEWDKDIPNEQLEPSKMLWCKMCQCFVPERELKRWSGDDALHRLCPGCDSDLLPVENLE